LRGNSRIFPQFPLLFSARIYLNGDLLALEMNRHAAAEVARQDLEDGPVLAEAPALLAKAGPGAALQTRAHVWKQWHPTD